LSPPPAPPVSSGLQAVSDGAVSSGSCRVVPTSNCWGGQGDMACLRGGGVAYFAGIPWGGCLLISLLSLSALAVVVVAGVGVVILGIGVATVIVHPRSALRAVARSGGGCWIDLAVLEWLGL
jgi:hypothetical protein